MFLDYYHGLLGADISDITLNATPEPATLSLFGLGLGLVAIVRRRRKN